MAKERIGICNTCNGFGVEIFGGWGTRNNKRCFSCELKKRTAQSMTKNRETLAKKEIVPYSPVYAKTTDRQKKKLSEDDRVNEEIWNSRAHVCDNCDKRLPATPVKANYSHLLTKGSHPDLRHDPENIGPKLYSLPQFVGIREKSGKHGNLSEAHCVHGIKRVCAQRPMSFPSGFSYSKNFIQVKASRASAVGFSQSLVIAEMSYKADGTSDACIGAIIRYPNGQSGKIVSQTGKPFCETIVVEPIGDTSLPSVMNGEKMPITMPLPAMTFDWKTLTDGYTLFAGEYHADTHLNFKGEWNWYAFRGTEQIGSGKGLKDSSISRAAAEKCILEHQKSANGGETK